MSKAMQLQLNHYFPEIKIEEKMYLDEIDHVPYMVDLKGDASNTFVINLEELGAVGDFPRIFDLFCISENGEKKVLKESDLVFNDKKIEINESQNCYIFNFTKDGSAQLTLTTASALPVSITETDTENILIKLYDVLDTNTKVVALLCREKASEYVLEYPNLSPSTVLPLASTEKPREYTVGKNELCDYLKQCMSFKTDISEADLFLVDEKNEMIKVNLVGMLTVQSDPIEFKFDKNFVKAKVWNRYKPTIKHIDHGDGVAEIELEAHADTTIEYLSIKPRAMKYDQNLKEGIDTPLVLEDGNWSARVKFEDYLLLLGRQKNATADVFVKCTIKDMEMVLRPYADGKLEVAENTFSGITIKEFKTKVSSLALNIKKSIDEQVVKKVAVFGSCYSRLAFSSSSFFNPDYKYDFKVVNTQFQTSTMSITTAAPGYDKIKKYVDSSPIRPRNIEYLKSEFEKTYFEELKDSGAEYFIFDLYADASLSLIDWGDKRLTTAMYYFKKELKQALIDNHPLIITHDDPHFLENWKQSIDKFMASIFAVFGKNNVILVSSKRAYEYLENGHKKKIDFYLYGHSAEVAEAADFWTDIMEDYIMMKYPSVKYVDMTKYHYLASKENPQKLSTNHYESNYYKSLMTEFRALIK